MGGRAWPASEHPRRSAAGASATIVLAAAAALSACSSGDGLDDTSAVTQIRQYLANYQCADYFTLGVPQIKDKMMNAPPQPGLLGGAAQSSTQTSEAIVLAVTPIAKTASYAQKVERSGLFFALAPCSDDFLSPWGRFRNLAGAFSRTAIGAPVNYEEAYRFQHWQSGWRLIGVDPSGIPQSEAAAPPQPDQSASQPQTQPQPPPVPTQQQRDAAAASDAEAAAAAAQAAANAAAAAANAAASDQ